MAFPLLMLLFLLLLPSLLVLCKKKKKSSEQKLSQLTSTTSRTSKRSQSEELASASTSKSEANGTPTTPTPVTSGSSGSGAGTPDTKTAKTAKTAKLIEIETKEENTQETEEEAGQMEQANIIWSIHRAFPNPEELKNGGEDEKEPRETIASQRSAYIQRISKDYITAHRVYEGHKCTHPVKKKTENESCHVCYAYLEWINMLYELHYNYKPIGKTLHKIEEDYFDYGGKLPILVENTEWPKIKEQQKKNMGPEKKLDPPVGTHDERVAKIHGEWKKMDEIIKHIDYWTSSDTVFRDRMTKDFEAVRKIYKEHDCRGLRPPKYWSPVWCNLCRLYMSDQWSGRLYKEVLDNEERCPVGMRKQLEEDFYTHSQKFEGQPPVIVDNYHWPLAKKRIAAARVKQEKEKSLMKAKIEEKKSSTRQNEKKTSLMLKKSSLRQAENKKKEPGSLVLAKTQKSRQTMRSVKPKRG